MRAAFALANAGAGTINKLKEQIGNVDAKSSLYPYGHIVR